MKLRFFITTFVILFVTVGTTTVLHFFYIRAERIRLIDREIEATASLLSTADFEQVSLSDIEEVEDYFHEVLGSQRAGKLILIRDRDGRVLFRSKNTEWLPSTPSHEPKWQTFTIDSHQIRLLGVEVPQIGKTIQVGMILDHELLHWRQLDKSFLIYTLAVTLLTLLVALIAAHILLKPLRNLANYLNHVSTKFDEAPFLRELTNVKAFGLSLSRRKDEFSELALALSRLTEKIRLNVHLFQSWTAQMAHEVKTPLTIIRNAMERLAEGHGKDGEREEMIRIVIEELTRIDDMVTNFLDWTSVENNPDTTKDLHAMTLADLAQKVVAHVDTINKGRLKLDIRGAPRIFANPRYVEQAIFNLLTNALKYSPPTTPVAVEVTSDGIVVRDRGPGIPDLVVKKLGQPFNFFPQSDGRGGEIKGTGLGLAWLSTICKKYGWQLIISKSELGSVVSIEGMAET